MRAPRHTLFVCDVDINVPLGLRLATIEDLDEAQVYDPETKTFGKLNRVTIDWQFEVK